MVRIKRSHDHDAIVYFLLIHNVYSFMVIVACKIGKLLVYIIQLSQVRVVVHCRPHLYRFIVILTLNIRQDFLNPRVIG